MSSESVLIEPGELAELLAGDAPPVLADVRYTLGGPHGRPAYEAAHLPSAQFVDLEAELSAPPGDGGRHPLPDPIVFQTAMRRIGLGDGAAIVTYDAANALAASRLWWLLTDSGHRRVRVLNGGLAGWQAADLPVESGAPPRPVSGTFVARPGSRRVTGASDIVARLGSPHAPTLVDVRAGERFRGETEPIDPVPGHIPGAANRPSMDNVDATGRFLDPITIAGHYEGLTDPVLYCGSGITAAHSLLALESAGLTGSIYPGSWSEWIRDPSRPIALGPG